MPGAYFLMQSSAMADYAASMKYTKARLIGTVTGSILHLMLVYLLVAIGGWGWTGICLATSLGFVARFAALWYYLSSI